MLVGVAMMGWIATGPRWSRARIRKPGAKRSRVTPANSGDEAGVQALLWQAAEQRGDRARVRRGQTSLSAGDYSNAVGLLEQVSKVAAVPVVFNNLGVLYAELGDKARAINAFREALARDWTIGRCD